MGDLWQKPYLLALSVRHSKILELLLGSKFLAFKILVSDGFTTIWYILSIIKKQVLL